MVQKQQDYQMRKIDHLPMWGRLTIWMYKCSRYRCTCGKRFAEKALFIDRYQRFSKEANQAMRIQSAKTFKEVATTLGTSISMIIRRFTQQAKAALSKGVLYSSLSFYSRHSTLNFSILRYSILFFSIPI